MNTSLKNYFLLPLFCYLLSLGLDTQSFAQHLAQNEPGKKSITTKGVDQSKIAKFKEECKEGLKQYERKLKGFALADGTHTHLTREGYDYFFEYSKGECHFIKKQVHKDH